MFSLLVLLLILLAAIFIFSGSSEEHPVSKKTADEQDSADWEYGDVWQQGSPDDPLAEDDDTEYVAILRGETGRGYSDTTMQEFIFYLGSRGIRAKYDSYPLEQVQVYVLKVEAGKAEEAKELLNAKFSEESKTQL